MKKNNTEQTEQDNKNKYALGGIVTSAPAQRASGFLETSGKRAKKGFYLSIPDWNKIVAGYAKKGERLPTLDAMQESLKMPNALMVSRFMTIRLALDAGLSEEEIDSLDAVRIPSEMERTTGKNILQLPITEFMRYSFDIARGALVWNDEGHLVHSKE